MLAVAVMAVLHTEAGTDDGHPWCRPRGGTARLAVFPAPCRSVPDRPFARLVSSRVAVMEAFDPPGCLTGLRERLRFDELVLDYGAATVRRCSGLRHGRLASPLPLSAWFLGLAWKAQQGRAAGGEGVVAEA